MQLKTYRARTMADALAEVKKDLGHDAVILHTRTFKIGGWFGIGGRPAVEVTASAGIRSAADRRTQRKSVGIRPPAAVVSPAAVASAYGAPTPKVLATTPTPRREPAQTAAMHRVAEPSEGDETPRAQAAADLASETRPDLQKIVREAVRASADAPAADASVVAAMSEELAAIKRMVGCVLRSSRQSALMTAREAERTTLADGTMPDALFQHYLRLLESEVAAEIADEVVGAVRDELNPAELADNVIVRQAVVQRLAAMIPADADVPPPTRGRDGRPLTIALVGPTGVGKTTTVAKLAAAYKLRHGKRVGLVTSDTYRIAAVDQLRTYADIIGLPLKVALSTADMSAACEALSGCDVVLIDTAGRSPNDSDRLSELRQFIEAARPHQTHLVLSSASSETVMLAAARKFAQVFPDRLIFTKLDEAVNFGVLVTTARKVALKLSYVTTGQEVPDHIEPGRPDRLARLVLDSGAPRGPALRPAGREEAR